MLYCRRPLLRIPLLLLLILLVTAACSQATPQEQTAPPVATEPVVRILDLSAVDPAALAAPLPLAASPTLLPSSTPAPTAASLLLPTLEAAQGTPALLLSPTAACTNLAEFVRHLSVSDFTSIKPGVLFAKIWRVKNVGDCVWTTAYSLVFVDGEAMQGKTPIPLPNEVRPGETVDLRVDMTAPATPNAYAGRWMLQDAAGNLFGLGAIGNQPLVVQIVVPTIIKSQPT